MTQLFYRSITPLSSPVGRVHQSVENRRQDPIESVVVERVGVVLEGELAVVAVVGDDFAGVVEFGAVLRAVSVPDGRRERW